MSAWSLCVVAPSASASLVRSCSGFMPKARINSLTVSILLICVFCLIASPDGLTFLLLLATEDTSQAGICEF